MWKSAKTAKIKAKKTTYARCAGRKLQIYLQWSEQRNPKQLVRAQIAVQILIRFSSHKIKYCKKEYYNPESERNQEGDSSGDAHKHKIKKFGD